VKLKYLLTYCNQFDFTLDYVCKLTDENITKYITPIEKINKKVMAERLSILEQENKKQGKDIAKVLGVSKSTYSGYKNPKLPNLMQTLMVKKLASKYCYSMDWLIGRSSQKKR